MRKEIVASIEGEIDKLLKIWSPPEWVSLSQEDDLIDVMLPGDNRGLAEYNRLKELIKSLKLNHKIELASFFKAYDFTREDLESSDLLWFSVLSSPDMQVEDEGPIEKSRCSRCQQVSYKLREVEHVNVISRNLVSDKIVAIDALKLFHKDVLRVLKEKKLDNVLKVVPCTINIGEKKIIDEYFWVYSDTDLGLPSGNIKVGRPCPECGVPEELIKESFLWEFAREKWHGENFCTSVFFGPDTLCVSQNVFKFINDSPAGVKNNVVFEPVILA